MLPITHILADLQQHLLQKDVILVAPPGAGKSTGLPLSLLGMQRFSQQKIIMLQPRRLAVRSIAGFLAAQLGETVGQTVGYRIRGETKVSQQTRLEIVTEGILTRMLQSEPELPGIGLIIFDEFHERSVHADFSLALCLEVQQSLRDDLRLLLMSATLDSAALSRLLPQAELLESQGRSFAVDIHYRPDGSSRPLADKITHLISDVFPLHQHDTLVFLPGAADIRQVAQALQQCWQDTVAVHSLYGELPKEQQWAAMQTDPQGRRKVVLATNIAETSLTIEGIDCVVDSGLEKQAIYHLNRGILQLQTQKISQASATQRAGRAGRLGPGTCYRLWGSEQQSRLNAQSQPEILRVDMAPFVLEAALWGSPLHELALLDYPSAAQIQQASDKLSQWGMFDAAAKLTPLGRQAHALGCHPNMANMLVRSQALTPGHQRLACAITALLENKDPLGSGSGVQLSLRLRFLWQHTQHPIWTSIRQWYRRLNLPRGDWALDDTALLLSFAFQHWIARTRQAGRYQLANGSGAELAVDDPLCASPWLMVAAMQLREQQAAEARILYAEALTESQVSRYFKALILTEEHLEWDKQNQRISASRQTRLGQIVLSKTPLEKPAENLLQAMWQQQIEQMGLASLPWSPTCSALQHRLQLARQVRPDYDWPDLSIQALSATLDHWLLPAIGHCNSWQQLSKIDFYTLLKNQFEWAQWQQLEQLLPSDWLLPSGRRHNLVYGEDQQVLLSVRIQELYGLQRHPEIAQGKIKLTVELLSPASRPIQVTQDLPGFWAGSYKLVQKDMKGRYPRHFWPDDPSIAPATTTTKKHMNLS